MLVQLATGRLVHCSSSSRLVAHGDKNLITADCSKQHPYGHLIGKYKGAFPMVANLLGCDRTVLSLTDSPANQLKLSPGHGTLQLLKYHKGGCDPPLSAKRGPPGLRAVACGLASAAGTQHKLLPLNKLETCLKAAGTVFDHGNRPG